MKWLLIASILLVVLYVGATIWKERKLPHSISAMVYSLPEGGWRYLWTIWVWAITLLLAPALFETIDEDFGVVAHCFATSLMFVGAMPLVKDDSNKSHEVMAILAGVFSQACVGIICPWWFLLWIAFAVIPFMDRKWYVPGLPMWMINSRLFLIEAVCAVTVYGSIITHLN